MNEEAKRSLARAPIEIRVEYQHLNALAADYTKNLSRGGAFIPTESPLPVGTRCFFTLTVPNLEEPLRLEAEVKHHDPSGDQAGMGVAFLFSNDDEAKAFHVVIDRLMFDHLGEQLYAHLKTSAQTAEN